MAHKIDYILFDCDNTLVLSESLAFEACAELANELLEEQGIKDRYTGPSLLKDFVGQNFRGMIVNLSKRYNFDIPEEKLQSYVDRELGKVTETLKAKAQPCVGVMDELTKLEKDKKYGLAVVSSSALPRVRASIEKTKMDHYFRHDWVYSAATSLPKPTSKPDPAIYNHAMKEIGTTAAKCVAVEDSRSGATAAKRAEIPLIGYVGAYDEAEEKEHMIKVLRDECGAIYVMKHWSEFQDALKAVENRS